MILNSTIENIRFDLMAKIERIEEEFLFAENPESLPGPGLILRTKPPFLVGKVVNFKTEEDLEEYFDRKGLIGIAKRCQGYRIVIVPIEPLMYSSVIMTSEVHRALEGMAE